MGLIKNILTHQSAAQLERQIGSRLYQTEAEHYLGIRISEEPKKGKCYGFVNIVCRRANLIRVIIP